MTEKTNLFPSLIRLRETNRLKMAIAASIMLWCATPQQAAANTYEEHGIETVQQANTKVKGTVVDETGEPMIGVSVKVLANNTGTITNLQGQFSIDAPKGSNIEISFIGYKTVTVKVTGAPINVTMKEDSQQLDEVVVVGYGSQKKVNVTGAVGMVNSEVLEARPVQNVSQALQGVVPGLNLSVNNGGGALDSEMNINIRGTGTIGDGSGSSPLILIDGIEGSLNTVNPNDIESVSVLKDAASASIYGARAAFGVVLVKTKSGQSGKARVTYSGNVRFSDATNLPEMLDSYTFAQYFNRAALNHNGGAVFSKEQLERIKAYQDGTLKSSATFDEQSRNWNYYTGSNANTDWFKEVYEDWVPSMDHNISISGGTDKTQYIVSGSFLDQKGLIRHGKDTFQRYTLNGRITSNITDWFTLGYSTKWTREDFERPSYLTGLFFHNVARRWPTVPVYDDNGYLTGPSELIQLEDGGRQINQKDLFTQQLQLTFEPIKNWKIYVEGSLRVTANNQHWEVLPVYQHNVDGEPVGMTWDAGVGSYPIGGSKGTG